MSAASALETVLAPLYAAVLEPERLGEFSAALCAATDSQVGAVMAHDAGHAGGRLDLLVGADPLHATTYEREFAAENPWMQRGQGLMTAGGLMDSDTVLARTALKRTRYYNEYLRISDVEQSLALCAQADAQGVVVATLCRAGSTPYSEKELAFARGIAPHWANAWAIARRLSWLEHRVHSLEAAVEASPMAIVMLDGRGRAIRTNATAERLLSRGEVLRLDHGRPAARFDPHPFRRLLHDAVSGEQADGRVLRRAGKILVRNARGQDALVADAHPVGGRGPGHAAAVLFLQPVGAAASGDPVQSLRQLFGLTASEATLACALLRLGGLASAAEDCGITVGTAQTRLKMIYDKTGVRGQVALTRLLSAVAAVAG